MATVMSSEPMVTDPALVVNARRAADRTGCRCLTPKYQHAVAPEMQRCNAYLEHWPGSRAGDNKYLNRSDHDTTSG